MRSASLKMPSYHYVFKYGHFFEKTNILKSTGNPLSCNTISGHSCNIFPPKEHMPFRGNIQTGNVIEKRGFSRSIGAD